jgi:DNA-binding SARP family transcriptional activator/tetratricopeptide (TPR) repeat protein
MQFRILGPLEAVHDAQKIEFGGRNNRVLLAMLLCAPNQAVSSDVLIDAIWGASPPRAARKNLHVGVYQLRGRLGGRSRIVRHPHGYELVVAAGELDAVVFEDLADRGRAAIAAGRTSPGRQLLAQALQLWRGSVLADIDGVAALREPMARLTERQLQVREERISADVAMGQHAGTVAELGALVVAHPLRERLRALQMVALYRGGRQAEALVAYQDARRMLIDELGVEPGPELQRVHTAILRCVDPEPGGQFSAGVGDGDPVAAPAVVKPAQLPPSVSNFVGRAGELAQLDTILRSTETEPTAAVIAALIGAAGVGKTALAVHWACSVADRFPDGQIFLDLRGYSLRAPMESADALAAMLRALGVKPAEIPVNLDEASSLYRSLLASRRVLVVLDNARSTEQVRPLLPGGRGCLVIVTSRHRLNDLIIQRGAHAITVDVLPAAEGVELLTRLLAERPVPTDPAAINEMARLCAYLPLVLRVAAAQVNALGPGGLGAYVDQLRGDDRLSVLQADEHGEPTETAVRVAFDLSYRLLTPEAQRTFRLLGVQPGGDFSVDGVAAVAARSPIEARRILSQLAAANLVVWVSDDRLRFHDLLHEYARERANVDEERPNALARLYDWYVDRVDVAAQQMYPQMVRLPRPTGPTTSPAGPFADAVDASAWLDTELPHLVTVIRDGASSGHAAAVVRIADGLRGYLVRRASTREWTLITTAAQNAAEAVADPRGRAAGHLSISSAHRRRGDYAGAIDHLRSAYRLSLAGGWVDGQLASQLNLASAYCETGAARTASELFSKVVARGRHLDQPAIVAIALMNLGSNLREFGRLSESIAALNEALDHYRLLGSPSGEADTLDNLGTTFHRLGELDRAVDLITQAIALQRQLGDRRGEASFEANLAAVHRDAGRVTEALAHAERAVTLSRETGSGRTEAEILAIASSVHLLHGDVDEAVHLGRRALDLAHAAGTRLPEINALIALAAALQRLGAPGAAEFATRAQRLAGTNGYVRLERQAAELVHGSATAVGTIESRRDR